MSASLHARLPSRHRQQRRDVLHHRTDRLKPFEPQKIQCDRPETDHRTGTVAREAMGVLLELGNAEPVPALDTPAVVKRQRKLDQLYIVKC